MVNRFGVNTESLAKLEERMVRLGIREEDLEERFIRGSGPGGQKVNKTASTVRLKHLPSGTEVRSGAARSQALNRFCARRLLCERFEQALLGKSSPAEKIKSKLRKQKKRRARRARSKQGEEHE